MRIRTIKPEFYTHEELSRLPEVTHYGMAAGLLTYADDEGFFNANEKLIKAAIFPLRDPSVSIHDMLTQLEKVGFIEFFDGSDGRRYGRVVTFLEHQRINRPTPSKIKALLFITDTSLSPQLQLDDDSLPERKGKEQGTGKGKEQGRGKGAPADASADPLGLNRSAWDIWYDYRVSIRHPIKAPSMALAKKQLAAYGQLQMEVVEQSIANGWRGLFPLKNATGNGSSNGQKLTKLQRADAALERAGIKK